jgi:hypothetical protein
MTIAISVQRLHAKVFDKVDTLAPNAVPKSHVSTSPIDEEQLAHTVESTLRDEPENNEEAMLVLLILFSFFIFSFKGE